MIVGGLLLFIAHPDDEVFCSGLVCGVVDAGVPVNVACLTSGDGGRLGSPPIATRENIAEVRRDEMRESAEVLGVSNVSFLGYVDPEPDGRILRAPEHDATKLRHDLAAEIARRAPTVVLTHGPTGEYGHPAHVLLHNMLHEVLRGPSAEFKHIEFYTFAAFNPTAKAWRSPPRRDWVTFTFDSTPFLTRKTEALWRHRTQYSVFVDVQDSDDTYRDAITEYVGSRRLEQYSRWPRPGESARRVDALMEWVGKSSVQRSAVADVAAKLFFRFMWGLRSTMKGLRHR